MKSKELKSLISLLLTVGITCSSTTSVFAMPTNNENNEGKSINTSRVDNNTKEKSTQVTNTNNKVLDNKDLDKKNKSNEKNKSDEKIKSKQEKSKEEADLSKVKPIENVVLDTNEKDTNEKLKKNKSEKVENEKSETVKETDINKTEKTKENKVDNKWDKPLNFENNQSLENIFSTLLGGKPVTLNNISKYLDHNGGKLDLYNKKISNLSGIESLKELNNLTNIDLSNNEIEDITPLKGFLKIDELNLINNKIKDITSLKGLKGLKKLSLAKNNLNNINSLEDLTGLEILNLNYNHISNISSLSNLKRLNTLKLYNNNIEDITPLSGLTSLIQLDLECNKALDIKPLEKLTNLEELRIGSNTSGKESIKDINILKNLKNLKILILDNGDVKNIDSLTNLINLEQLEIYGNEISDITPLQKLTNLKVLNINSNNISDISPISKLTKLTTLNLSCNTISYINSLSNLKNLNALDLSYNLIGDDDTINKIKNNNKELNMSKFNLNGNFLSNNFLKKINGQNSNEQYKLLFVKNGNPSNELILKAGESINLYNPKCYLSNQTKETGLQINSNTVPSNNYTYIYNKKEMLAGSLQVLSDDNNIASIEALDVILNNTGESTAIKAKLVGEQPGTTELKAKVEEVGGVINSNAQTSFMVTVGLDFSNKVCINSTNPDDVTLDSVTKAVKENIKTKNPTVDLNGLHIKVVEKNGKYYVSIFNNRSQDIKTNEGNIIKNMPLQVSFKASDLTPAKEHKINFNNKVYINTTNPKDVNEESVTKALIENIKVDNPKIDINNLKVTVTKNKEGKYIATITDSKNPEINYANQDGQVINDTPLQVSFKASDLTPAKEHKINFNDKVYINTTNPKDVNEESVTKVLLENIAKENPKINMKDLKVTVTKNKEGKYVATITDSKNPEINYANQDGQVIKDTPLQVSFKASELTPAKEHKINFNNKVYINTTNPKDVNEESVTKVLLENIAKENPKINMKDLKVTVTKNKEGKYIATITDSKNPEINYANQNGQVIKDTPLQVSFKASDLTPAKEHKINFNNKVYINTTNPKDVNEESVIKALLENIAKENPKINMKDLKVTVTKNKEGKYVATITDSKNPEINYTNQNGQVIKDTPLQVSFKASELTPAKEHKINFNNKVYINTINPKDVNEESVTKALIENIKVDNPKIDINNLKVTVTKNKEGKYIATITDSKNPEINYANQDGQVIKDTPLQVSFKASELTPAKEHKINFNDKVYINTTNPKDVNEESVTKVLLENIAKENPKINMKDLKVTVTKNKEGKYIATITDSKNPEINYANQNGQVIKDTPLQVSFKASELTPAKEHKINFNDKVYINTTNPKDVNEESVTKALLENIAKENPKINMKDLKVTVTKNKEGKYLATITDSKNPEINYANQDGQVIKDMPLYVSINASALKPLINTIKPNINEINPNKSESDNDTLYKDPQDVMLQEKLPKTGIPMGLDVISLALISLGIILKKGKK